MPTVTLRDVFEDCQKGIQSHGKLAKTLKKIYTGMELEEFWPVFLSHLKYALIVFRREPVVERTLDFVAKFAVALTEGTDGEGGGDASSAEENGDMHPFVLQLFNFLLRSHNACEQGVRYRCCQMVNKLLYRMGDEAQIDDDLYDRIYECMLQRLRDKCPIVRVQAVFALSRLQDPNDQDCPVIDAYLFLLGCDRNADVRRAVLVCIAPSTKTLSAILERTRDVKDTIRKRAYQVLADKVHIKALTIAQRVRLLQTGLGDRVEAVRNMCVNRLLQNWLRTFEGNILELLKCLDVENSLETAEKMLFMLFKKVPHHELIQNFDLLNEQLVIPVEELSCESAFYWRVLCQHLKDAGLEAEEQLEKVMPNVTPLCEYIKQLFSMMRVEEDLDAQLGNEFILTQLLHLAGVMDLGDEVGRRNLEHLVHDMLVDESVSHSLVKPLLARYSEIRREAEQRVVSLVEIISEIREPISGVTESGLSLEAQRQLDIKLAGVRVELNQVREELETCVQQQEFNRAAELKQKVSELEQSKVSLLEESKQEVTDIRTERNDPQTLLKCLTIAAEMLKEVSFKALLPSLITLIEVLILPGIQNEDPAVRNQAVLALGLNCLMHKDTAKAHLLLFVQISQVDMETVRVTALQVIFDLLHTFGLDAFQVEADCGEQEMEEEPDFETDSEEDEDRDSDDMDDFERPSMQRRRRPKKAAEPAIVHTADSLLRILASLLDSDCSEIRTVAAEGLAKLLLSGRVVSPKLLSRLLLLWYNPVTEDDTHLRHCLGTFFPVYAFACRSTQEVVADAVIPTLRILFNAPASSPLAEVNVNNVVELLVQLTNHRHIVQNNDTEIVSGTCHDSLAVKVSNEILSDPNSFNTRTLCKVLNLLELTPSDRPGLKDLKVLGTRMLKEVKDKLCAKMLQKYQRTVKDFLRSLSSSMANDTTMYDTADETMLGDTNATQADDTQGPFADDTHVDGTTLAQTNMTEGATVTEQSTEATVTEDQPDAAQPAPEHTATEDESPEVIPESPQAAEPCSKSPTEEPEKEAEKLAKESEDKEAASEKQPKSSEEQPKSPEEQPVSPKEETKGPEKQAESPKKKRKGPEKQPESPKQKAKSPEKQPESPKEKEKSAEKQPASPKQKAESPEKRPESPKEKEKIAEKQPESPKQKAQSPEKRPESPREKAKSPEKQPESPKEQSKSPEGKTKRKLKGPAKPAEPAPAKETKATKKSAEPAKGKGKSQATKGQVATRRGRRGKAVEEEESQSEATDSQTSHDTSQDSVEAASAEVEGKTASSEEEPVKKKTRTTRSTRSKKEPAATKEPVERATRGRVGRGKPAAVAALTASEGEDSDGSVFASPTSVRRSNRSNAQKQAMAKTRKKLEDELESQDSDMSPAPKKTRPTRSSARSSARRK